jgi:hypothetical protein
MDIKEIIEDAREAGFLICNREYFGGADELLKFAELTLKRSSLSVNKQDSIDAERYRYLKENYVMANFNIYDDEDFSNGQTGLIIEVPNGIGINRDLDLVVDQAIANKKGGV